MQKFFYMRRSNHPGLFCFILGFTDPLGEDQFSGHITVSGTMIKSQIEALSKDGYIARQ
jgi:hypothetical protein